MAAGYPFGALRRDLQSAGIATPNKWLMALSALPLIQEDEPGASLDDVLSQVEEFLGIRSAPPTTAAKAAAGAGAIPPRADLPAFLGNLGRDDDAGTESDPGAVAAPGQPTGFDPGAVGALGQFGKGLGLASTVAGLAGVPMGMIGVPFAVMRGLISLANTLGWAPPADTGVGGVGPGGAGGPAVAPGEGGGMGAGGRGGGFEDEPPGWPNPDDPALGFDPAFGYADPALGIGAPPPGPTGGGVPGPGGADPGSFGVEGSTGTGSDAAAAAAASAAAAAAAAGGEAPGEGDTDGTDGSSGVGGTGDGEAPHQGGEIVRSGKVDILAGEFVVNRAATERFRPLLEAMNLLVSKPRRRLEYSPTARKKEP